jgi:Asp-tRNA(Asn)/Glu-tRNA(Gln) amidotransferase A subunit family amidase
MALARPLSRRDFLTCSAALSLSASLLPQILRAQEEAAQDEAIATQVIAEAERLAGLEFTDAERELMRGSVSEHLASLKKIQELAIPNAVPPAMVFRPLGGELEWKLSIEPLKRSELLHVSHATLGWTDGRPKFKRPDRMEELYFAPLFRMAELLRKRLVTSTELTKLFIERLKHVNDQLECVISFTEERALEQAAKADEELSKNVYRGALHGIPWGAKDLLAVKGYPTTWGAAPYRDQVIDGNAEVVRRLDEMGAVLIAKTTVGALAWGDVWFGGTTKNPWNLEQGSSGSSAGSAAAVAAGALPFALGTETLGSIISPCTRVGATGLRPTFGRVPRTGCMALTWSMDKIGPIARRVEDAALVLQAIQGADGKDPDAVTAPLEWTSPKYLDRFRFGYDASAFEQEYEEAAIDLAALDVVRGLVDELVPVELPDLPVGDMLVVLEVEAAAAFDELTRNNRDDELVRQVEQAWPNVFRAAQLVPAVQYVQAQRARALLMRRMEEALGELDGYVTPSFAGQSLLITNLTGHPTVVLPNGFREDGTPTSLSFVGRNYREGSIAALAMAYEKATPWHERHPAI